VPGSREAGLHVSFRLKDGNWSDPVELGNCINPAGFRPANGPWRGV
jgi:hypothetical protein